MLCLGRLHVDELAAFFAFGKYDNSVDKSEDGMILTHANVKAGMVNRATLTLDDVACFAVLTTENLYTESFAF